MDTEELVTPNTENMETTSTTEESVDYKALYEEEKAKAEILNTKFEDQRRRAEKEKELRKSSSESNSDLDELKASIAELKQQREAEEYDKKFDTLFNKTMGEFPEFNGVVNKETIKTLYKNSEKDLSDVLKDVYGNVKVATKGFETTSASTRQPVSAKKLTLSEMRALKETDPEAYRKAIIERQRR